ncbi:MAG: DUF4129 domain-containing protein [Pseudomonadota bacterium]
MEIDKISVALRPRSHWQAIDLGVLLGRRYFLQLVSLLVLVMLTVYAATMLLFSQWPTFAYVVLWWFKPVYELPLLHFLSRAIFGEQPTSRTIYREFFALGRGQWLALLTYRRLSFSRSFDMPVVMLERLTGAERSARIDVLHHEGGDKAQWLTAICVHFEVILLVSAMIVINVLIPPQLEIDIFGLAEEPGLLNVLFIGLLYMIVFACVAPFYVASGFALYLSRRTELEGWDLELSFKSIEQRLQNTRRQVSAVVATMALLVCLSPWSDAVAEVSPTEANRVISDVLSDDHFGEQKSRSVWVAKEREVEEPPEFPEWLRDLGEVISGVFSSISRFVNEIAFGLELLLWATLFFLLLYFFWRVSPWLRRQWSRPTIPRPRTAQTLFGLDLDHRKLPDDVRTEVLLLIERGEIREATALLYRASLSVLVHRYDLVIPESSTEGECLRLVHGHHSGAEASFFERLTRCWQRLAYAHEIPDVDEVTTFCEEWSRLFDGVPATGTVTP